MSSDQNRTVLGSGLSIEHSFTYWRRGGQPDTMGARRLSTWRAAWLGICSHGSGMSAMAPGGPGCPGSRKPAAGATTRCPSACRRKRCLPAGEVRPIYSDAWVEARQALIEAKNSDSRDVLRQAVGQLYDYRRFHHPPVHLAVLLPYPPNAERLDLLRSAGIEAVWRHGSGFRDSARGAFVSCQPLTRLPTWPSAVVCYLTGGLLRAALR
jgi:hypothetical protein